MTEPTSQPVPTEIAVAVVERDGRFLVGQRPANVALGGLHEFPGGKVEPGETPADAAVRECLEEAGVSIEVVGRYPAKVHAYAHDHVRLHFFACRLIDDEARDPLAPFRWVSADKLSCLEFPAANASLIAHLEVLGS